MRPRVVTSRGNTEGKRNELLSYVWKTTGTITGIFTLIMEGEMNCVASFELTEKQTSLLAELFEHNNKETGMILGQFMDADKGNGFVHVAYLNSEQSKRMQLAMGVKEGKLTPKKSEVYVDME